MKQAAEASETSAEAGRAAQRSTPLVDVQSQFFSAMERHKDDADFVTALARGLAVMMALSEKRRRISIAQVSHLTRIPRAAARRSLHTLVKLGFVAMDEANLFYLRPRILSLSHAYLSASPLAMLSQPILDKLGEDIGESCSLAVLDSDEIVYLARSSASRVISPSLNVGRRIPAYCTSIGRILLAHLPEREREAYLESARLQAYTEHTVTERAQLRAILAEARAKGYAFSREQLEPRLSSLAVPVRDTSGQYVAGINVLLPGRPPSEKEATAKYFHPLNEAAIALGHLLMLT
jgi:IclR family pca regulon transcriptional regulator